MKPFLVDVPVKLNIWIRPEFQKKQFEVIKRVRPSILFLVSDGGRNEEEWKAIYKNRKLFDEGIDWECTIYKYYFDENQGLYKTGTLYQPDLWSKVDRCIFMEDDQLPSDSFFEYCRELLELYETDTRINVICGYNHLDIYEDISNDYFFSNNGSIWGIAMWRRTYEEFNRFDYRHDEYTLSLIRENIKHNKDLFRRVMGYKNNDIFDGHIAGTEFFIEFGIYAQHHLQIIPRVNMINNMGADSQSVHSDNPKYLDKVTRKLFNKKIYELNFPLKHPYYVMPDYKYDRKRNWIMGYNHPWITRIRKFKRLILLLKGGRLLYVLKKLYQKVLNKKIIEK